MRPKTDGILESALYVTDIARSVRFYQETFGFLVISDFGPRGCALQAGPRQVLLLFKKGASREITSPHDGDGELHLAFAISAAELANWESWLAQEGIVVEEKREWELGGTSLYFRDPESPLARTRHPGHLDRLLSLERSASWSLLKPRCGTLQATPYLYSLTLILSVRCYNARRLTEGEK